MASCLIGDRPLSEPCLTRYPDAYMRPWEVMSSWSWFGWRCLLCISLARSGCVWPIEPYSFHWYWEIIQLPMCLESDPKRCGLNICYLSTTNWRFHDKILLWQPQMHGQPLYKIIYCTHTEWSVWGTGGNLVVGCEICKMKWSDAILSVAM